MADVNWSTFPIVLTSPAKGVAPVVVVTEHDIDITILTAPDKSSIGDAVEEVLPTAIAAGFFYNGASFTDYTTEANEATANDVFLLHEADDFFYIGEDANIDWIAFNIGTAGTGSGSFTIEYSTLAGWSTLPSTHYASTLNDFKTAGFVDLFISAPDDWDDQVVNGETRRWIRFNGSGTYTIDPLATQIWTNTISTNRFLTASDSVAVQDTDAANWTLALNKVVLDSLAINEFTTGFGFSIGIGEGFADVVVITDILNIPQSLEFSDTLTISELFATLNGPRLLFADAVTIADLISLSSLQGEAVDDILNVLLGVTEYGKEWMGYIAIGTGTTPVDELRDDELDEEVYRKKADVWSVANTYFSRAVFGQDEPTGDDLSITEIGIFADASGGTMARRWLLENAVSKDNIDELPVECRVVFFQGTILEFVNTLEDSVDVADVIIPMRVSDLTEAASVSDSAAFVMVGVREFLETVSLSDSAAFVVVFVRAFSDTLAITDSADFVIT